MLYSTMNLNHQENMSVKSIPPHTPLLHCTTGGYRGISIFLICDPKHRLWVLVRTASAKHAPTIKVLSKHVKTYNQTFSNDL